VRHALVLALAAAAIAAGAADAAVPPTISFSARLVDEASGAAVTGEHHVEFELFDAETGGASVWKEGRDLAIEDGLLFVGLGEVRALDGAVFNGRRLFLQVTLDGAVMEPRISLESVPYAIRASGAENADAVGGVPAADLQHRILGGCGAGSFITGINSDGSVACAPDLSGTGDITAVNAGSGLEGGDTSGDVTLSLVTTCAPGELLKWGGTAWGCAPDANAGGDITSVAVGAAGGLAGGSTSGDVTLSLLTTCAPGQLLKWNGSSWGCAIDLDTDTNSGGDITAVTTGAASGLVGGTVAGDAALSLLTSCAPGQLLKWNGAAWGCAADLDTDTNSGGDITDVAAGAGLVGGGTTGAVTLDVAGGTGIAVAANSVSLDLPFTDGRWVNVTGDTMVGSLDMADQRLLNRGCPAGHVRVGPGLCTENVDQVGFTFTGCSNRCRAQGTHMCSSSEIRAIMASGVALGTTVLLDWIDDQIDDDDALYVNNDSSAENPDGSRATTTSSWCRCCANVE
jgi:hypothetical protein